MEALEKVKARFESFPAIFKNTFVGKSVFGNLMNTYAEEEGIMSQPRKLLISSLT